MATGRMRLDALLSRYGYCSRREAGLWIKSGRVTDLEGGKLSSPALKSDPYQILVDNAPVDFPGGILVAMNKPVGYTCSHDEREGRLLYELLPPQWLRRNPIVSTVGRLDKETSGLILLTDDGVLLHKLSSPKYHLDKVYELTTSHPIPLQSVSIFASGSLLLSGERTPLKPAHLEIMEEKRAYLTLTEGRYHQVRRMMESQGCPVITLQRIAIGSLTLDSLNLNPGEWKEVAPSLFL